MGYSEKIPFFRFLKIVRKNGGIDPAKFHHLAPWLLKYIFIEPLRITEILLFNKKIRQHQIEKDPIFILGFYRTGTTYLQRLFAQNRNLGYQTVFHSALPEIILGFEWLFRPVLTCFTRLFRVRNDFHKIPFTWDFPGEEDVAMTSLGFYESPNWGNLFPKCFLKNYQDYSWSEPGDGHAQKWKGPYLFWVKKLSLRHKGKRMVLKSPPNTARIATLLELFPHAKFVCLHRNPFHVYASCQRFWKIVNKHYAFQKISAQEINENILYSFDRTMDCYHSMKGKIPAGNLFEITHESLAEQPFTRFEALYKKMNMDEFSLIEENIKRYISQASNYAFSDYQLSPEERQRVKDHWGKHIDYWEGLRKQYL